MLDSFDSYRNYLQYHISPQASNKFRMKSQQAVTAEWDSLAGEWDDMAGSYRDWFVKQLWEETGYYDTAARKDLVVVDFGCATGLLTESLQSKVKHVVSLDAAPTMVQFLKNKIRSGDWKNVDVYCAVLGHLDQATPEIKTALEALNGQVDIVAASSVLNFVPEEDKEATLRVLGGFLKPGTGVLFHTDWPQGEDSPDGFTVDSAQAMYQKSGLEAKTTKLLPKVKMGPRESEIFLGIATKSAKR